MRIEAGSWPSRSAALLILLLLIALAATTVAWPVWILNRDYSAEIDRLRERMGVLRRFAVSGAALESQFQALKRAQVADTRYLKSPSEALAAAELQRLVKKITRRHQGEILSTRIVPAGQEQGFTRVTLRVRMKGSLESIVAVFYDLETGRPYLFLDDVSLRGRAVVRRRSAALKQAEDALQRALDAEFSLSAYIRSGAA